MTHASHVCPKSARISRAPGALQDAGPGDGVRQGADSPCHGRGVTPARRSADRARVPRQRLGAEQGRPVPGTHPRGWVQAPGVAEPIRGEGRQTFDTHD